MPKLSATLAAALAAFLASVALLLVGLAAPSLAQNEDDIQLCERPGNPWAERIAACTRVIEAGGLEADDLANIHEERGELLIAVGEYEMSLDDFDAMLMLDPATRDANRLRGLALLHLGRTDEALVELDIAIAINARFGFNLYLRGLAHAVLGNVEEALADFAAAVSADPGSRLPVVQSGRLLLDEGRLGEAGAAFEDVLAREPFEARAYAGLGMIAEAEGDIAEAIRNYRIAQLIGPNLAVPAVRLPALVPERETDRDGPLTFALPLEGLTVSTIAVLQGDVPELGDVELEIGDRIYWLAGPPTKPAPTGLDLHRWEIGETNNNARTDAVMARVVNATERPIDVEYTNLILPFFSPIEEGEGREIRYSGLDALWSLAPGESAIGVGRVYFLCPEEPGAAARARGCDINVPDVRAGTIEWTARFAGWEYVLVPAGYRLAARIEVDALFAVGFDDVVTVDRRDTIWLDPEINWWIKRQRIENGVVETVEAIAIEMP